MVNLNLWPQGKHSSISWIMIWASGKRCCLLRIMRHTGECTKRIVSVSEGTQLKSTVRTGGIKRLMVIKQEPKNSGHAEQRDAKRLWCLNGSPVEQGYIFSINSIYIHPKHEPGGTRTVKACKLLTTFSSFSVQWWIFVFPRALGKCAVALEVCAKNALKSFHCRFHSCFYFSQEQENTMCT